MELNVERYLALLTKLIGDAKHVQNSPPKFIPEEDKIIAHLMEVLAPHSEENGGVLKIQHVTFVEKRGNLILEYRPPTAKGTIAFVGSHLDVVPADPANWRADPFKLLVEGDVLYGRGTTDCLGHVALFADMFVQLAEQKPQLNVAVIAVLIASEESNVIPGVGVDMLMEKGYLDGIKDGPVYWVDSADSQPCIGTAAALTWKLRAEGKLFHSGLPHKGINSIELADEALAIVQRRFYEEHPPRAEEGEYRFATPSTMKPTQIRCSEGGLNQIPPWTEVQGDIRLTPFYSPAACASAVEGYVTELNGNLGSIPTRGSVSKYELPDDPAIKRGNLELTWSGEAIKGVACNLESPGFGALRDAVEQVKGSVAPYSICGSLPLIGDLQAAGFDVQVIGFGKSAVYHGDNEYCLLSDMQDATRILYKVVQTLSDSKA